jgi:pimeloyl-ACP methyl ester carboxylesterase
MDDQTLATIRGYRPIEALVPPDWSEGDVSANGIRQHYYRTGAGGGKPPLLLLHGILAGGLTWLRVAKALASDYDVVMLDARDHGRSEHVGAASFSYPILAEDAAAAIRVLGLERPAILGHSMGGATAALLAARYPDLPRAVILEDAAWSDTSGMRRIGEADAYRAWLASYVAYLERLRTLPHAERLVAALAQLPPGTPDVWPEEEYVPWVEAQAQLDLDLVRGGTTLWSTMGLEPPLAALADTITCPMLLLSGASTRTISAGIAAEHANVRHVAIEDAGHLVHLDQLDRFLAVVRAFLEEQEEEGPHGE